MSGPKIAFEEFSKFTQYLHSRFPEILKIYDGLVEMCGQESAEKDFNVYMLQTLPERYGNE